MSPFHLASDIENAINQTDIDEDYTINSWLADLWHREQPSSVDLIYELEIRKFTAVDGLRLFAEVAFTLSFDSFVPTQLAATADVTLRFDPSGAFRVEEIEVTSAEQIDYA